MRDYRLAAVALWLLVAFLAVVFVVGTIKQDQIRKAERACVVSGGTPWTDWPWPLAKPHTTCWGKS